MIVSGVDAIRQAETNNNFMNRVDDKWILDKSYGLPYGKISKSLLVNPKTWCVNVAFQLCFYRLQFLYDNLSSS